MADAHLNTVEHHQCPTCGTQGPMQVWVTCRRYPACGHKLALPPLTVAPRAARRTRNPR